MCSRYELNSNAADLMRQLDLPEPPPMPNAGELRPTDRVLAVDTARNASLRAWGIPAPWDGKPIFNARSETLREKPTFSPYLKNRFVLPASAYFEWRKDGAKKTKMRIRPSEDASVPFCFAALGDAAHVTIVTCTATASIADIHARMPVLLDGDGIARWLDPHLDLNDVAALLRPLDLGNLTAAPAETETAPRRPPDQPDLFA